MGLNAKPDHRPILDVQTSVVDQCLVDGGVHVLVIDGVVDMAVDVVISPASGDPSAMEVGTLVGWR